jgi:hypothetical protein
VDVAVPMAIVGLAVWLEIGMGRAPVYVNGPVTLWHGDVNSDQNSQQVSDPYTFTHVIHGAAFFGMTRLTMGPATLALQATVALSLEAAWEAYENTDTVINRYRAATIALGYYGDSVLNSVADMLACLLGFALAGRFRWWVTVAWVTATEIALAIAIRDNLTLNIIMLLYPSRRSPWQLDPDTRSFSRRELRRAGGASPGPPGCSCPCSDGKELAAAQTAAAPAREALETLTAAEAQTLEAITARLIPTDQSGPGAAEARAAHYIDRALGGALSASREAYQSGLAAADRYAQTVKGAPFARLAPTRTPCCETWSATWPLVSHRRLTFFGLVLAHTIQGVLRPLLQGNAGFVGWDLILSGVRLAVTADQRAWVAAAPTCPRLRDVLRRKPARASLEPGGGQHGD